MVMKSPIESVAESMGNILDQHADPHRHLEVEVFSKEAFIHWNGPVVHRSRTFLVRALEKAYPGKNWRDQFSHREVRADRLYKWKVSEVLDRHYSMHSKLPFME